jgi:hypothetical protein
MRVHISYSTTSSHKCSQPSFFPSHLFIALSLIPNYPQYYFKCLLRLIYKMRDYNCPICKHANTCYIISPVGIGEGNKYRRLQEAMRSQPVHYLSRSSSSNISNWLNTYDKKSDKEMQYEAFGRNADDKVLECDMDVIFFNCR